MADEQALSRAVEFIVDNYRVSGELAVTGGPRRLVDILNALDDIVTVRDATLDYPLGATVASVSATVAHVHLNTILFGITHGPGVRFEDPFEKVNKVATPCTIVVPGFEISGNIYMVAEADPNESQMLTTLHFVPLTDGRAVSLANPSKVWEADVLVVNLKRALVYAPRAKATAAVG
jgi:hypothetical protein